MDRGRDLAMQWRGYPRRFTGTCEKLGDVNVTDLVAWVTAIPFEDWHQQARLADGLIRPMMMTDLNWHGFGRQTDDIVDDLIMEFGGCGAYQRMLSVVMPGHSIAPHRDEQRPTWLWRYHVPLISNPKSRFIVGGEDHVLVPGSAYRVNTEAVHAVTNDGDTPRIHFMFDVSQ